MTGPLVTGHCDSRLNKRDINARGTAFGMKIVSTSLKFGETSVQMGTGPGRGLFNAYTDSDTDPCKGYLNVRAQKLRDGVTLRFAGFRTSMTPDGKPILRKSTDILIPGIARSDFKYYCL